MITRPLFANRRVPTFSDTQDKLALTNMITTASLLALFLLPTLALPASAQHDIRALGRQRRQEGLPAVEGEMHRRTRSRTVSRQRKQKRGVTVSASLGSSSDPHSNMTPNGIKAGISAGDAYDLVKDHIGWWYGEDPARGHKLTVLRLVG